MEKIIINGESVNLKKGMFGYRVVYPGKNDDGTYNWANILFGGWANLIQLLFILFVILSLLYGIIEMNRDCLDMAENFNTQDSLFFGGDMYGEREGS